MMLFMTRLNVTKKEGDDEDSHYMMTMTMITRTMTMMKLKTHHSGFPSLGSHLLKGGWSCRLGEENAHKVAHPFILKRSATDLVLIHFHDQIPDFSNGFGSLFLQKDFQKPHK